MAPSVAKVLSMLLATAATSSSDVDARHATDRSGDAHALSMQNSYEGISLMQSESKLIGGVKDLQHHSFGELLDDFDTQASSPSADVVASLQDAIDTDYWAAFSLDLLMFAAVACTSHFLYSLRQGSRIDAKAKAVTTCRVAASTPSSKKRGEEYVDFGPLMKAFKDGPDTDWWPLVEEIQDISWAKDVCGCTALHVAAYVGSAAMAQDLIGRGADVNAREAWEETPLHVAARQGAVSICKLLIRNGAELNPKDGSDHTPLLSAGHAGQQSACEFLLDNGGDCGGVADNEIPPLLNKLLLCRLVSQPAER